MQTLQKWLLFQYLVIVLQGDFLSRNGMYEVEHILFSGYALVYL